LKSRDSGFGIRDWRAGITRRYRVFAIIAKSRAHFDPAAARVPAAKEGVAIAVATAILSKLAQIPNPESRIPALQ
jgi:hypothetical protein